MPKPKIFKGAVRQVSHFRHDRKTGRKYLFGTRGFIKPYGPMRKNLAFETDLDLGPDDWVRYKMDRGEPIIIERIKKGEKRKR